MSLMQASATCTRNLRTFQHSLRVSIDRTWFPRNVQLTCISPVRSAGTNETAGCIRNRVPDRFTVSGHSPEFSSRRFLSRFLARLLPLGSRTITKCTGLFRCARSEELVRALSQREGKREREREREHTAGGHKSRFAIAGHWKRLMKPLWAKNTSLTVLGNWHWGWLRRGGGRREGRGKEEELPSSEPRGFDSTHSRIMLGCNDSTTRRRQLFERNVVRLWFSRLQFPTRRMHFVSWLPNYYAGLFTLFVRYSYTLRFFFFFLFLRKLFLRTLIVLITVTMKNMDTLFYLLHVFVDYFGPSMLYFALLNA